MYEFITDNRVSKTAENLRKRYSQDGLFGVILDVVMLSECDYIVCTFSSQVCVCVWYHTVLFLYVCFVGVYFWCVCLVCVLVCMCAYYVCVQVHASVCCVYAHGAHVYMCRGYCCDNR